MISKRSLRCWVVVIATAIAMCVAARAAAAVSAIARAAGNAAGTGRSAAGSGPGLSAAAAAEPHATGTDPTTSELFLCIGPTAACPSTGLISPPPPPASMLAMSYGQTWNGTMDAYANDGTVLTGSISLEDAYNGAPPVTLCTLDVATGGQCDPSVGVTQGTEIGTHVLTAVYSGDATHAPSVSASVTIVVSQDTTAEMLSATPNPSPAGQPVTLTATVAGNYAAPDGTVTFMYGGAVIGSAALAAGAGVSSTATMTTSTLPVGTDTITAVYASTTDFESATATAMETITPLVAGSFLLSVTPNPVNVGVGYGTLLTVAVAPLNGFAQDVNLTCGNLPQEVTCLFVTPTIAGGSGTSTLIVQTTAPHTCGTITPYFYGRNGSLGSLFGRRGAPIALPALAGLAALLVPFRRRRWLKLLVAMAAVMGAMQMTGCGTCTDLGTRPATYSIEVTGTAQGGSGTPATASQAVTVNVTI